MSGVSAWLEGRLLEQASCQACSLSQSRHQVVIGRGSMHAPVMFLGEAPGRQEDATGRGFQGSAGKLFDDILVRLRLSRDDIWLANVVRCRPTIEGRRNRPPSAEEIAVCRHWLDEEILHIRPQVIVTLGRVAFETVTAMKWDRALRGRPVAISGAMVFPLYHPAYLIYRRDLRPLYDQDLQQLDALLTDQKVTRRSKKSTMA